MRERTISFGKKYEISFYWDNLALGLWVMREWFGMQIGRFKMVISKKCEPIEPLEYPK